MKRFHGNPVPHYIKEGSKLVVFEEMENMIRQLVTKSYADKDYDKVIKALQAYRAEAIDVAP